MKTDTQLQRDVIAERQWKPSVHAARIGVEVKNGVVTLVGQVADHSAWGMPGLRNVVDMMTLST